MDTIKSKSKKSSKSSKHKKKRAEKVMLNNEDDSDDLSLDKELHSIGHYVNDRQKMVEHMFSTMTEEKLRGMLPPIIKDDSLKSLQSDCLEALLGMSSKRIKSILAGEDLGSQSSETESEESRQSSSSEEEREVKELVSAVAAPKPEGENLLEIVELQLRARAIRAALEHQCLSPETQPIKSSNSSKTLEELANINKDIIVVDSPDKEEDGEIIVIPDSPAENKPGEEALEKLVGNIDKDSATPVIVTTKPFGKSKKNVVVIGPKRKTKSKIVYSQQPKVSAADGEGTARKSDESDTVKSSDVNVATTASNEDGESKTEAEDGSVPEAVGLDEIDRPETDETSQSWMQRWLHVQETDATNTAQKKTSKIITSVKQKLREESKKTDESTTDVTQTNITPATDVIGTVCEYQLLPQSALAGTFAEAAVVEETTADGGGDLVEKPQADEDKPDDIEDEPDGVKSKWDPVGNDCGDGDERNAAVQAEVGCKNDSGEENVVESTSQVIQEAVDDPMCSDELELHYDDFDDGILPATRVEDKLQT